MLGMPSREIELFDELEQEDSGQKKAESTSTRRYEEPAGCLFLSSLMKSL